MALVTFYFQLHQPFRLHPDREKFLWDEKNKEVFCKVAQKCYVPALRLFVHAVERHPTFKLTLSMSGTFLAQARDYQPEVIGLLEELYNVGEANHQVEYLDETYYHSLAGLFSDAARKEFVEQVSRHRNLMVDLFDIRPQSFRNTELMYNNEIAQIVVDMGYHAILCEKRADMYPAAPPVSANAVFRAKGSNLLVLPRNRELSDDVAYRFSHSPVLPKTYAGYLSLVDGEAVILGYDFEHIGEHIWEDKGIFEFWQQLPAELEACPTIVCANPSEIAEQFQNTECPEVDIHGLATSSWADATRDTFGWLGNPTQQLLFARIQQLEEGVKAAGGERLRRSRHLTTSDQLYFMHEGRGEDHAVHAYFSPYDRSVAEAVRVVTDKIWDLEISVRQFQILKKTDRTPVVLISPETDRLPSEEMGQFAQFVAGKSGGMGEVVAALCRGLTERGLSAHLITLNLRRHFLEKSGISEEEWVQQRHNLDTQNIHLVSSSFFENHHSAYDGDPIQTACEFQRQIINSHLINIRNKYRGRALVHSHDWMAGGAVAAYARLRHIPLLHTVHNTHTGYLPVEMLHGVNMRRLWPNLYLAWDEGRNCMDAQATAIKSANKVSYVGKTFLREVVHDYFLDRHIVPDGVRQETKAKFSHDSACVIPNGISPSVYPENQPEDPDAAAGGLACRFGLETRDLIQAKQANLVKFQQKLGLIKDPNAILLYWPSRLDQAQKGIELLEDIAQRFVEQHGDVQIAVVGNPVGAGGHGEVMGRIAYNSGGKIAYRGFCEDLSILGYAAASDVFGASLYEPFGQIDVVGNLYGATATNRDTGGFRDKIVALGLKAWGAPKDRGNGVLFRNYSSSGLWWGLTRAVENHRYFRQNPEQWLRQMRRMMKEARAAWSLDSMVAGYITLYENLNHNKPLG